MKCFFLNLYHKFCEWFRPLLTKENLIYLLCGEALFWSPLIVIAVLAICVNDGYWGAFAAVYAVWVWALPAIPIQIAFAFFFKWLISKIRGKKNDNN